MHGNFAIADCTHTGPIRTWPVCLIPGTFELTRASLHLHDPEQVCLS